ncbi:glycoside hydrolase family 3 protein [Ornithinimicrobium sp. LYQ103]|uniref:glycoside hydrolase family 3 protein n=1 Tax=Ornithinimicrobium sp. LYQ103 TaxID=3378796 RepID=UPI003853CD7B
MHEPTVSRFRNLALAVVVGLLMVSLVALAATWGGRSAEDEAVETPGAADGVRQTAPATTGDEDVDADQDPTSAASTATADATTEPTEDLRATAAEIVADLSLTEKAGQVIVAAHDGPVAPVDLVVGEHLGGVIVMDQDLSTDQLSDLNRTLTEAADAAGRTWPVFLGVDQEGGLVERAKGDLTRFPAFMSQGAADDTDLTRRASAASGAELRGVGFTVVFAPAADVTTGPGEPTIGSRSVGSDPEQVARHATAAGQGYLDSGILPVVKHFPGHGSVPADSHLELPVQTRTMEELRTSDLVPFVAAVEAGLPAVMVAHIQVQALGSQLPSSLEPLVVEGILRGDLGFDGLVVTDALNMAAVADRYGPGQASVEVLRAGADVVLMPTDPLTARDAIVAAVSDGTLDEDRLDDAVARQITALLQTDDGGDVDPLEPGGAAEVSQEVSAAAITIVQGPCSGPLIDGGVVPMGDPLAVQRLEHAAESAGVPVGTGTTVELLRPGQPSRGAQIAVALETPYLLGGSGAPVRIALFGDTPGAVAALVDVLTGEATAPGRLPVPVDGVERAGC